MDIFQKKRFLTSPKTTSNEIQLQFLKRLSRALDNGYPLLEALETLKWDKHLRILAVSSIVKLKKGYPLDEVLDQLYFHPMITSYIYFVRTNGELQSTIQKCLDMFEKRLQYITTFKRVIRYPIILLTIFSILLFFINQSVLPSFSVLLQSNSETSIVLHIILFTINHLGSIILTLILSLLLLIIVGLIIRRKMNITTQLRIYTFIPFYKKYLRIHTSYLFATHLSSLLTTGMSMKEILTILSKQNKLPIIKYYSKTMATEITKGVHISDLLEKFTFIDPQLANIFQKNSNNDMLEKDLTIYASFLTEELHQNILKILSYLQPVILIIIGLFIISIYITIMWPMFQLIETM